jgi:hypothetical protein
VLTRYHEDITRQALSAHFNPPALEAIVRANLGQDDLGGQFGHDEFHFDNSAFERTYAYIEEQRALVRSALSAGDAPTAWVAFGRLIHSAQDFYAHSNYVDLWLARFEGQATPSPADIQPMVAELLSSPDLCSGRLYYPLEFLSFLPALKRIVLPFLPRDSHAWMNLDAPAQGPKFAYAFEAARMRTQVEFDQTVAGLSAARLACFCGAVR